MGAVELSALRCGRHHDYASTGTCARCGSFCCRACAPSPHFPATAPCQACDRSEAWRTERLAQAHHHVRRGIVTLALRLSAAATMTVLHAPGALVGPALLGALAVTQWVLPHTWPADTALLVSPVVLGSAEPGLARYGLEPALFLLVPAWLAASGFVLLWASTLRSRARALAAAGRRTVTSGETPQRTG